MSHYQGITHRLGNRLTTVSAVLSPTKVVHIRHRHDLWERSVPNTLTQHTTLHGCICSGRKFPPRDAQLSVRSQRGRGAWGPPGVGQYNHKCSDEDPCTYHPHGDVFSQCLVFFHLVILLLII